MTTPFASAIGDRIKEKTKVDRKIIRTHAEVSKKELESYSDGLTGEI